MTSNLIAIFLKCDCKKEIRDVRVKKRKKSFNEQLSKTVREHVRVFG